MLINVITNNKYKKHIINRCMLTFLSLFIFLLMSPFTLAEEDNTARLIIEVPFVELHSGPGVGYPVINIIEYQESVKVLVKRTNWLKIEDKRGNQGWFHQNALIKVSLDGEQVSLTEIQLNDFQQRTWEGGVMYGDLNGSSFYNVSLGYIFNPVISTELSIGKSQGDISDNTIYDLMLISQPLPELTISPYLGVGVGIINTEPHSILADAKTRENTLIAGAIGAKYYLTRNFILRAEYKYSLVLTDLDDNEEIKLWKVGFSVFF